MICATKNIKLNIRKPCLNERTSKQFFTEITKGDIKIIQFQLSRINVDIPICNKVVWIFL